MTTQTLYKCDICKDTGFTYFEKEDKWGKKHLTARFCKCRIDEINQNRIKKANVSQLFAKCTFYNFKENNEKQKEVKKRCIEFYIQGIDDSIPSDEKAVFLLLSGQAGRGKTHLAVATLNNFIANSYKALYTNYKELVRTLSQHALDNKAFNEYMQKCKQADILLIDDLFKSSNEQDITKAQLNYMYELINQRYAEKKLSIFTTQKSVDSLLKIDEATASRIIQLTHKKYIVDMTGIENQRLI